MTQDLVAVIARAIERLLITGCVPLLLFVGYRMFLEGASGRMQLSAKSSSWSGRLTNVAPGSLCFLLATALGIWSMSTRVTFAAPTGGTPATQGETPALHLQGFLSGGDGRAAASVRAHRRLAHYALALMVAPDDSERERLTDTLRNDFGGSIQRSDLDDLERAEAEASEAYANKNTAAMTAAMKRVQNITSQWKLP